MSFTWSMKLIERSKKHFYLLLALALATGCTTPSALFFTSPLGSPSPITEPMPDDLAFSLSYGSCDHNRISTFDQSYTKDMLDGSSITVSLILSQAELASIYTKMVEIGFFDYPEQFQIEVELNQEVTTVIPFNAYAFTVQHHGAKKSLTWRDEIIKPTSEKADQLRALIHFILDLVNKQPAVQQLPETKGGCL